MYIYIYIYIYLRKRRCQSARDKQWVMLGYAAYAKVKQSDEWRRGQG